LTRYVLDASVAAKWFLAAGDETLSGEADALLRLYAAGEIQFFVPDLFFAELGNVLWKAERLGRCDRATVEAALTEILNRDFPRFSSAALLPRAVALARAHGRTVYDSLYLALAIEIGANWVTADERLVNALRGRLPVVWLGMLTL
jgi:predicted nucleic acid-binding protein